METIELENYEINLLLTCYLQFASELFASSEIRSRFYELPGRFADGPQRSQLHEPLQ